jgi:hypothetical protein
LDDLFEASALIAIMARRAEGRHFVRDFLEPMAVRIYPVPSALEMITGNAA